MKKLLLLLCCHVLISTARGERVIADSVLLKEHVYNITGDKRFRNIDDTAALNSTAQYIIDELERVQVPVQTQEYRIGGKTYKNILTSFGPHDAPRIIVGAHYDVCGNQWGADDNASGVAALLELARLLSKQHTDSWNYRIDLVAYTLEEPPSFRTENMGSAVHAKSLFEENAHVAGMISIEMIGFYKDEKHTQHYPLGFLKWFYGPRGNYITVVKKLRSGKFTRQFARRFKHGDNIITKVFSAPKWVPGMDFSDHLNYWGYDWEALMITDTSFFRNEHYHQRSDMANTLDYARMSYVVANLYNALSGMAQ
jgi:hypothetical protein